MKKGMSILLTIAMLCSMTAAAPGAAAAAASKWATDSVDRAQVLKLINADDSYDFPAAVMREKFCELIFSYLANLTKTDPPTVTTIPFTDTDNEHIAVLHALGLIEGKTDTEFVPQDFLTREEAAAILYRLILQMYPNENITAGHFEFADSDRIADWAKNEIQVLCSLGIMKGVTDNQFAPKALYTAEQAIVTLIRIYDRFAKGTETADAQKTVDEKFMLYSLPWGETWENVKDREIFSSARVIADDGHRFAVELNQVDFLGAEGTMVFEFSVPDSAFPLLGLTKVYFSYDEKDENNIITQGNVLYGERQAYFLDHNGVKNPLNPSAWYSPENIEETLLPAEREQYEAILNNKGIEQTRADAIIRGPLVIISADEERNIITIHGDKAANVFHLRHLSAVTD